MKLEVRSLRVPRSRKRDRLRFFGKKTILNVHETGVTIEGLIPDVWYPILMRFIYRTVSDWSIRTIPFSRVRACVVRSRWELRSIISIATTTGLGLLLMSLLNRPLIYVAFLVVNFAVVFLMTRLIFKEVVDLEYETKNARRCALRIRFSKPADQLLLFQELSRHRLDVAAPELAKVAKNVTQRRSFFPWNRTHGGKR